MRLHFPAILLTALLTSAALAGAWGVGSFENDDALDWVYELQESSGLSAIETAIRQVAGSTDYIEAPEGSYAIAAAETLAAMLGKPSEGLPEELTAWVARQSAKPDRRLLVDARRALRAVLDPEESELAELWRDSPDFDQAWRAHLASLQERLQ